MFQLLAQDPEPRLIEPSDHASATTQTVTSPLSIGLLLERIKQQHRLLSVCVGTDASTYSSVILAVEKRPRYIVIDELSPAAGQVSVAREPRLQIATRIDAVDVSFACRITATGKENDLIYYKVPFPETLIYRQKRCFHRAFIPLGLSIPIVLQTKDNVTLRGELRDLSIGGFSARLTAGVTDSIREGDVMPRCIITLPSALRITANIEICHLTPGGPNKAVRIGARFFDLSRSDTREIERLVSALERDTARQHISH